MEPTKGTLLASPDGPLLNLNIVGFVQRSADRETCKVMILLVFRVLLVFAFLAEILGRTVFHSTSLAVVEFRVVWKDYGLELGT